MREKVWGRGLLEAFGRVPAPRGPKGRPHPLPAILALATAAMLSGARSLYAIAQGGRLQDPAVIRALGFTRDRTPSVSTLHLVLSLLDIASFERALREWAQREFGDRREAIAIDAQGNRGIQS